MRRFVGALCIGAALLSHATAADMAHGYRELSSEWFGGEMFVRCGGVDFKITRNIWQQFSVEGISKTENEWRPMIVSEASERSIRFWLLGYSATIDGDDSLLTAQLYSGIAGRSADGGFAYFYNYHLEPKTKQVALVAELDFYDRVLRTSTAEAANFIWDFDNMAEYSVPASVPLGSPIESYKCEGR